MTVNISDDLVRWVEKKRKEVQCSMFNVEVFRSNSETFRSVALRPPYRPAHVQYLYASTYIPYIFTTSIPCGFWIRFQKSI